MARGHRRQGLGEELRHNLQIGLATGFIGGALLGFLGAAAVLVLNPDLLGSFGNVIRILLGLQLVYALLCLALGMAGATLKTLFFLVTGRSVSDTKSSGVAAWLVFFLIGALYAFSWVRWQKIGGLAPGTPITWTQLPILLAVVVVSALLAGLTAHAFYILILHYKKPVKRRPGDLRRAFLILAYMAGAFAVFLAVVRVTVGRAPAPSGLTRDVIHAGGRRILLLALDGIDDADLERLRRGGRLAWIEPWSGGVTGPVRAPAEPVPPIDWTLVATGQDLAAHGIADFQTQVVRGLPVPVAIGPEQLGLFDLAQNVLPFLRLTRSIPMKSWMRESKSLWNITTDAGRRAAVVNWWVSWPAERVLGAVVSDHAWVKLAGEARGLEGDDPENRARVAARVAASVQTAGRGMNGATSPLRPDGRPLLLERETWPSTLLVELVDFARPEPPESLRAIYGSPPSEEALRWLDDQGIPRDAVRADCFHAQSAAWLLDRQAPDLWMLYLPGPDVIRRVLARTAPNPAEREEVRRRALEVYWSALDPPLGRALSGAARPAAGEGRPESTSAPLVLILALPGAPWKDSPEPRSSGVYFFGGPGARFEAEGAALTLAEVAPTILWLMGLPSARDMAGEPRTDWLTAEAAAPLFPARRIPTYGRQETEGLEEAASNLDEEMLERFRSLGYIH